MRLRAAGGVGLWLRSAPAARRGATSARTTTRASSRRTRAPRSTPTWRRSASGRRSSPFAGCRATRSRSTERPLLDLTVAAARRPGSTSSSRRYPYPPREIEAGLARPEAFGAWLAELAQPTRRCGSSSSGTSPTSRRSGGRSSRGRGSSPRAAFGPFLAAGYDALKARRPDAHGRRRRALSARERPARRGATSRRRPSASSPRSAPGTARAAATGR